MKNFNGQQFEEKYNECGKMQLMCLICGKKTKEKLCITCQKNPFSLEKARQKLSETKDYKSLQELYSSKFPEIENLNTPVFWDTIWSDMKSLSTQDGMTKDRVKTTASLIPLTAKKILDIGAGYGFIEELLKNKEIELFGNDISSESIKRLKSNFKGQFKKESIYEMKYEKNTFDTVLLLEVLEHIPPMKTFTVLKTIHTILKPKGYIIISVPTNEGLEEMDENPNGHLRMYTESLIKAELEIAGFKIMQIKTFTAFKSFYTIKKYLAKILKNKWQANDILVLAQKI